MHILVLTSSPNFDGLTAACAAAALEGIRQAGASAEEVRLNDLDIGHCEACGEGWGPCQTRHSCQALDDFQALHARAVQADGLVLVSPFGNSLADFFQRLLNGESAVRLLRLDDPPRALAIPFVSCPSFAAETVLGKALAGTMDRFAQLGTAAAFAAWDDAGLGRRPGSESRERWGVTWGTALGGTLAYEKGYRELWQKGRERISPLSVILGMNNAANAHISIQLGLGGVSMSHTVACASSAIAIGEAFRREGHAVDQSGLGGADGGIDLVLRRDGRRTLVQCKQWRRQKVPVNVVREMYGLLAHHGADEVCIVALGGFTPDAARFAQGKPIRLVDGAELLGMVQAVQARPVTPAGAPVPPPAGAPAQSEAAAAPPPCPRCGGTMLRRSNRTTGKPFWGCAAYPKCRGTLA